ncbi:unnamed protein product [Prorocentrum cordatum]|uniref:Myotubularin phosphatase domain-containing protein n=1 Tax=Prorocentrum cordatum TaxID=2364126 RepID=A0ABN9U857_9DINO|nr:unnamed protein product [Polarella glacialis]
MGRALEHIAKMPNAGAVFVESCGRPTLGWDIGEDARAEFFERQGAPQSRWRLTEANWNYEVCDTYPRSLAGHFWQPPARDDLVRAEAKCRAKQRFPVLTYFHQARGSALLRCSQPVGGKQGTDKEYLELCRKAVHQFAALIIFDCRSQVAAAANRLRGGGQEDPRDYSIGEGGFRSGDVQSATVISLDVPNMHDMRSSWGALQDLVNRSDVAERSWLQKLGDTMWLDHCRRVTESAVSVAYALDGEADGSPPACVVVHCSDGWDRTAQVCALAQLLSCKRFRTRQGFSELVEKDWRRFGHRFAERSITEGSRASPIFLQWLFCVHMVVDQFPGEFEFGSEDLKLLADLRLCGGIGTFLFNSEREARLARAERHEISVWAVWLQGQDASTELLPTKSANMADWVRMAHRESSASPAAGRAGAATDMLLPITSLKSIHLWSWALRYDEVAFARQKAYSTSVGRRNPQRLGGGLVIMLRESGASECKGCGCDFSFSRRRNHCRGCGLLFQRSKTGGMSMLFLSSAQIFCIGVGSPREGGPATIQEIRAACNTLCSCR